MKDYRITGCQSKQIGLDCSCPYCVYVTKECDKYFDDSVKENFRDWRIAKMMELEDRIKTLENCLIGNGAEG